MKRVYSLANICNHPPYYLGEYIKYKNYSIDRNIEPYLKELAPSLFQAKHQCTLAAEQEFNCTSLFRPIVTDAGLCYIFNQLPTSEIYNVDLLADDFPKVDGFQVSYWHLKDFSVNGSQELRNLSYPYRMRNAGKGSDSICLMHYKYVCNILSNFILGLDLRMLVPTTEHDYLCSDMLEGFKIQIHSAEEVPRLKKIFYHAAYDSDIRISVRANLMMTSPSLIKNYSQQQRKCIAENEHNLIFFKKYTQRNCHLDTLALQTKKICGCVLFHMPRLNSTRICSYYSEYRCVEHVENSLYNSNLTTKCLPDCESISYDAEISMSRIEPKTLRNFVPAGFRIIKITVLFKDQQYFASLRSELYGTMEFMATSGGILSLFMGISLLSLIEIFYFATIRLTCNLHKRNLAKKRMLAQQNILNRQND